MKKSIFFLILIAGGCIRNVKYATNPVQGKAFYVAFQEQGVKTVVEQGHVIAYRGSCTIVSRVPQVVTLIEVRTTGAISNRKSSINTGVILAEGQQTLVDDCFEHPAEVSSVFQIVYKIGESLYTDDIHVSIAK